MPATTPAAANGLGRIHALLAVQSLVVVLVSINRLSRLTLGYVAPNEFLRWVDLHNMLTLPLVSIVAFYLLKKTVEAGGQPTSGRAPPTANLALLVGVFFLGAGYGDHEVTNYLHSRFCRGDEASPLCRIVTFNDDEFSHWVFFAGFVLVNAALMLLHALFPRREPTSGRDTALIAFNAVLIGAGIFANLAFERIGLDLYVVALLPLRPFVLLRPRRRHHRHVYS